MNNVCGLRLTAACLVPHTSHFHLITEPVRQINSFILNPGGGGGWVFLGSIVTGYVPLASQNPYSTVSYFVCIEPILVTFGQNWNAVSKILLGRIFLALKIPKMCDPILVTPLKIVTHYREVPPLPRGNWMHCILTFPNRTLVYM